MMKLSENLDRGSFPCTVYQSHTKRKLYMPKGQFGETFEVYEEDLRVDI